MMEATARTLAGGRSEPIDPDSLLGLEPLGLRTTGQCLIEPADGRGPELVVEARTVIGPVDERLFCTGCGAMGRLKATVARLLAHAPTAGRVTRQLVRIPEIACQHCRRVRRVDLGAAAAPRALLSRGAVRWALEAVAVDNTAVSRVAARLGASWDTANNAVLSEGKRVLIETEGRFDGVTTIGVDEHVVRHEALLFRMGVGDLHLLVVVAAG